MSMTEHDFDTLRLHLREVRPIFAAFCASHEFEPVSEISLGRYPRIRVQRSGTVTLWFDLWMELGANGRRFQSFKPDLPYELAAGAYVDVPDGSKFSVRFQKSIQIFSGRPFETVNSVLSIELKKHIMLIEQFDLEYLQTCGQRVPLGR